MTVLLEQLEPNPQQVIADLQRQLAERTAERDEALARETAIAEVLQVINSSPGDLTPVFAAMLEKATRLCDASFGIMNTYDGAQFHRVALHGMPPDLIEAMAQMPPDARLSSGLPARLVRGEDVVHLDLSADVEALVEDLPRRTLVEQGSARTYVAVALRKDRQLLGMIAAYRKEVRPFTDKQIALLQNFAAQAVIAMENARLITETREALEQQTATAEVLQVINSSPGDLTPVFDAMLEKATDLCEAAFGAMWTFDGGLLMPVAWRNVPSAFAGFLSQGAVVPGPGTAAYRFQDGERQVIQSLDLADEDAYRSGDPLRTSLVDLGGARTALHVPLVRDDDVLGVITVFRQEIRSFTDKQAALLQNFAAQAVIAMENARLITETREALEQQTATAEVLQVINSSPGDLTPVFDAMLEKAIHLCDAAFGTLWTYDGEFFHPVALRRVPAAFAQLLSQAPYRPEPGSMHERLLCGEVSVQIADIAAEPSIGPVRKALVEVSGARTFVGVPLHKDDIVVGAITAYRQEVRPFTDKQIALLQNFASQAVIAMENARLITETRDALEQQTATAEVLQVINSSPGDLAPVFDAILEKAHALCGVTNGALEIWDGKRIRALATRGLPAAFDLLVRQGYEPGPDDPHWKLLDGARFVHIADQATIDEPTHQKAVELGGFRTFLAVALRRDEKLLGRIVAARQEVRPFSEKEITLIENFAAQAVIAMENARLLGDLRERTADLQESLEYQTATSDVLKVISRSTFDLQPVLDMVVETAARLCTADQTVIFRRDGEVYDLAANFGFPAEYEAALRGRGPHALPAAAVSGRAVREGQVVHVHDVAADPDYPEVPIKLGKQRTSLAVPLLRQGEPIGVLALARQRVEPFTERQIELVRTFADQAVIAIENTRLLTELRESLEQQQAISEVLQGINSSPGDLGPIFNAILEKAHTLGGASRGTLFLLDGTVFRATASHGYPEELPERLGTIALSEDPQPRVRPNRPTL